MKQDNKLENLITAVFFAGMLFGFAIFGILLWLFPLPTKF